MKRLKRILFLTLVVSMTAILCIGTPMHSAAVDGKKQYIEDLVVVYGKDYADAKAKLNAKGNQDGKTYYPIDEATNPKLASAIGSAGKNINGAVQITETAIPTEEPQPSDTDFVLVGYSITTNKQDAITDVAMMNTLGAFDFDTEYAKLLQEQKSEIHDNVEKMRDAFELFADNAIEAMDEGEDNLALFGYHVLDKFYNDDIIDSETGKPISVAKMIVNMDDYSTEQIDNMFLQMSGLAYVTIQKYVFMGCLTNWVSDVKTVSETAKFTPHDHEKAQVLLKLLPDFQENIVKYKANGISYNSSDEDIEDYLNNMSDGADRQFFLKYACAEAGTRSVTLSNGKTLYDVLMQDTESTTIIDSLLPIAYCVDDDISCLLGSLDLADFFNIGNAVGGDLTDARELADIDQIGEASIYAGVDRSLYNADGIAVTDSANNTIQSTNQKINDQRNKDNEDKGNLQIAFGVMGIVSLATGAISLAFGIMSAIHVHAIPILPKTVPITAKIFFMYTTAGAAILITVGVILLAAFALLLTFLIIKTVRVDKADAKLRTIPRVMVDCATQSDGSKELTYYYCVKDTNGNNADLNAGRGSQWMALYYTKDAGAGNPLTATLAATSASNNYMLKTEVFMPVHIFGETQACNIFSYSSSINQYMGFSRDTTPKDDTEIEKNLPGATSVINGTNALFAFGGGILGAGLAIGAVALFKNKKKKNENKA